MEETKNNFIFDLQLFSEETTPNVEQPTTDSTDEGVQFDFGIDESGEVFVNDPSIFEGKRSEPAKETPTQTEEQPLKQEEQMFTITVGGVEEQVTLDELQKGYMRTSDYTRKTQALAEERRMYEDALRQAQPQTQPPVTQPTQTPSEPVDQRVYYQKLAEFAKQEVSKALGEDYDEYNVLHQAAFADTVATVKAQIFEQQQVERARQEKINAFANLCEHYKQDPNFEAIDILAQQKLDTLPYHQSVKVRQAFQNYDLKAINEYMDSVRNEYYSVMNPNPALVAPQVNTPVKPKVAPPFVERGGNANPTPDIKTQIDFKALGKMTTEQQAKVFSELGLSKL